MQTYKKNMDQIKDYDIATSLPMKGSFFFIYNFIFKDGEYALKKKYYNPGEFRHIR